MQHLVFKDKYRGMNTIELYIFQIILGAGHHVYADKSDIFNETVNTVCQFSDEYSDGEEGPIEPGSSPKPLERRPQEKSREILDSSTENKLPSSSVDKVETKTNLPSWDQGVKEYSF